MEDNKLMESSAPTSSPDPSGSGASGNTGVFGTKLPLSVAMVMVVVLPIAAFLVGIIGVGKESSSTTVTTLVEPNNAGGTLEPGKTVRISVVVENPHDYGVQVVTIGSGSSEAMDGCSAGVVTTEELNRPPGYIRPHGVRTYPVVATMSQSAGEACVGKTFTLQMDVDLESAAG